MGRRGERPEKRQREFERRARASAKAERRRDVPAEEVGSVEDPTALLESFRILSEAHAAGEVSGAAFEQRREEIFAALGLDPD